MRYTRFVAVGDSLTQGRGDTDQLGNPRGFADLLAQALRPARSGTPSLAYANLARASVRTREVTRHQVRATVAFEPDLLTVVAGVNDVIALRFDQRSVATDVEEMFGDLRRGLPRTTILTATLPDLGHVNTLARLWKQRVEQLNEATRRSASRHGLQLVELADGPPMTLAELSLDRVHPSAEGHLRFARAFGLLLGVTVPTPSHMAAAPSVVALRRAYRTAVVAPRFLTRRIARRMLIAGQPPKRPELLPL